MGFRLSCVSCEEDMLIVQLCRFACLNQRVVNWHSKLNTWRLVGLPCCLYSVPRNKMGNMAIQESTNYQQRGLEYCKGEAAKYIYIYMWKSLTQRNKTHGKYYKRVSL